MTLPANFNDELVANLNSGATALAFTPDGRLLFTTQPGTLHIYKNGALLPTPALDLTAVTCSNSERGLLGVAVDPSFATNHFIYLYYTYKKTSACETSGSNLPVQRVSRFVLGNNDTVDPATETVLIDNIPNLGGNHDGGDLQFGNDGNLYAAVGDGGCDYAGNSGCAGANDASRDEFILLGKILRITPTGGIPATNPFQGPGTARCNTTGMTSPGNRCQETYAWGLRNPFRLAFDPNATPTRFFINDVGQAVWEEIDLGQAGADYGWNVREGPCANNSTTDCGPPPAGMTNPIAWYGHTGGCTAITGGAFVPNGSWPSNYNAVYLYADLGCGNIFELRPQTGGGYSQGTFASGFGSNALISLTFGPSSSGQALYYITWNGPGLQIRRITYNSGYPSPVGASPVRVPIVPAFKPCETSSANAAHGAPLNFPSCSNPQPASSTVRIGSNAIGFARIVVCIPSSTSPFCNPAGGLAKPDIRFTGSIRDVKCAATLPAGQTACAAPGADYNPNSSPGPYTSTGDGSGTAATPPCFPSGSSTTACLAGADLTETAELPGASVGGSGAFQGRGVRITDRASGASQTQPATVVNIGFPIPLDCITTPSDPTIGSTCGVNTTANALVPGVAREGDQAVWQLGQIELKDSGPDGTRGNGDDELFGVQGIFLP